MFSSIMLNQSGVLVKLTCSVLIDASPYSRATPHVFPLLTSDSTRLPPTHERLHTSSPYSRATPHVFPLLTSDSTRLPPTHERLHTSSPYSRATPHVCYMSNLLSVDVGGTRQQIALYYDVSSFFVNISYHINRQ